MIEPRPRRSTKSARARREEPPRVVEGEVVRPDGTPLANHPVVAFDRALCEWRALGLLVRTDKRGRYRITYTGAQLKAWGKTRPDLRVQVFEPTKGDAPPATVLATSPLILQALPHEIVNFAPGDEAFRGLDELTRVEQALRPHVETLEDLNCLKLPDVLILARAARLSNSQVACYVKARRIAGELDAPLALFYGLMRRQQPARADVLLARPTAKLLSTLREANEQNIIDLPLGKALRSQLAELQQRFLTTPNHPYTTLLATTALTATQRSSFTRKLIATELTGDEFWKSLESDDSFSAAAVAELRDTYELQSFADDNTSLTVRLRGGLGIRHSRQVAAFSVDDWRKNVLTKAVDVPDDVLPGQEDDQRRVAYAQQLYRIAEARFPTASLAGQMARDRVWSRQPTTAFFTAFPEFEFTGERVTAFLQRNPKALDVFPDADSGRADLLRIEQLFHLTPLEDKLSVIQPLWNAGLRSAPQMAFRGRQQLMRVPGLDPKAAASIYRQAVHIASVALHVYLRYHPRLNGLSPVRRAPAATAAKRGTGSGRHHSSRLGSAVRIDRRRRVLTLRVDDQPGRLFRRQHGVRRPCRRQRRHRRQRPR